MNLYPHQLGFQKSLDIAQVLGSPAVIQRLQAKDQRVPSVCRCVF